MKKKVLEKLINRICTRQVALDERNRCLRVELNALREKYNRITVSPYAKTRKALDASEKKFDASEKRLNLLRDEIKSLIPCYVDSTGDGYLVYLRNAVTLYEKNKPVEYPVEDPQLLKERRVAIGRIPLTKDALDALPEVGMVVLWQEESDPLMHYDDVECVTWRVGWYKGARVKQRVQH